MVLVAISMSKIVTYEAKPLGRDLWLDHKS